MIHTIPLHQSVRFNSHLFQRQEGMGGFSLFGFSASFRISSKVVFLLGIASKPGTSTFSVNEHQPEGLGSVGITRLHRYYALIRLPQRPADGYAFPKLVGRDHAPPASPSLGISQVSDFTFDTRCSQPPRIARQLHLPVASLPMVDFTQSGGLVAINSVTRPNRIHWRCGWRLCPDESHPRRLLRESVAGLHVKQAIYMVTSLQITS